MVDSGRLDASNDSSRVAVNHSTEERRQDAVREWVCNVGRHLFRVWSVTRLPSITTKF